MTDTDKAQIVVTLLEEQLSFLRGQRDRAVKYRDEAVTAQQTWEGSIARLNEQITAVEDFMGGILILDTLFVDMEDQIKREGQT